MRNQIKSKICWVQTIAFVVIYIILLVIFRSGYDYLGWPIYLIWAVCGIVFLLGGIHWYEVDSLGVVKCSIVTRRRFRWDEICKIHIDWCNGEKKCQCVMFYKRDVEDMPTYYGITKNNREWVMGIILDSPAYYAPPAAPYLSKATVERFMRENNIIYQDLTNAE